ncbi:MAG TPA: Gfo/Idh/MocA family oxidoreductase [Amaricoccus sp.]|nr:Gfo/Idh/MocA family oxidoreductase [Amaricoccus sp.]
MTDIDTYALRSAAASEAPAPALRYRPPMPRAYRPRIVLIGAGGISAAHLAAYAAAGLDVAVIASRTLAKAEARRDAFFPAAEATDDIAATLARPDIAVADVTPHPADRLPLIEAALAAGKHVLSQKPFVLDLADGRRLCGLAEANGLRLAVNQNGRWAPHLAYLRQAVRAGLVGAVHSVEVSIHWDHSWIAGTSFDGIDELILCDFAVHWLDFVASLGLAPIAVTATRARAAGQAVASPLLAQATVGFDGGLATLAFDGAARFGACDRTVIAGRDGTLAAQGPDLSTQAVTLATAAGLARPALEGTWFREGFLGTMGELLAALEEDREPENGARANLDSLALVFAAIASAARGGIPVAPGEVTSLAEARG